MKKVLIVLVAVALGACAPKIYVVDRQTVLETEASGDWPQFDREIVKTQVNQIPVPFPVTAENAKKQKISKVLNGDIVSKAK